MVTLYSDVKGETSLTLGQGDIFVWASKGKKLGFGELSVERQDTLTVVLDKAVGNLFSGDGIWYRQGNMILQLCQRMRNGP